MSHKANPGGKGPKVTKQSGNKGPIFGRSGGHGTNKSGPHSLGKGTNRSMNFGKDVKKS